MAQLPECLYTLDGTTCHERGDHFCVPRADHVTKFFQELLLHTKGRYVRVPFKLTQWQADDIIRPLFGMITYTEEFGYKRQYEIAWIEIARKNGKSELLAGVLLYLLVADNEMSAELYGIAKDKEQAALVFDVASQMVVLQPILKARLKIIKHKKLIYDPKTNSTYRVIAADAGGALGSNPHGVGADEILAWPNGDMWTALRTGMGSGARKQPLMIAATTAGNDSEGFAGQMHNEMVRIADDPSRSKHTFVYVRNLAQDADPWDEKNWFIPNPGLGDFLSLDGMRKQAEDAKNNPLLENGFRQFRLNQWVSQAVRWMPMHTFDAAAGQKYKTAKGARDAFTGRECWFGLDLAARQDLTAWCLLFPNDDGSLDMLWRFWAPESAVKRLDDRNSGRFSKFAEKGWLTVTEGNVLDFKQVYDDIEADGTRFEILGGDVDIWSSDPVINEIQDRLYMDDVMAYTTDFKHCTFPMHHTLEMVIDKKWRWHGNPLARFCFEGAEAKFSTENPDLVKPVRPSRSTAAKRIDAVPAALYAMNAWYTRGRDAEDLYDGKDVLVV